MKHAILTVLGKDRAGIIARISGILFKYDCNLEDVSMTILEGEFAMIAVVCMPRNQMIDPIIKSFRADLEKKWGMSIFWKPLTRKLNRGEKHQRGSESYLIRVMGKDRTGIVYKTSQLLAKQRLNITDLNCRILGSGRRTLYMMLLEVDIPKKFSVPKLKTHLNKLSRSLGVEIKLKPLDLIHP